MQTDHVAVVPVSANRWLHHFYELRYVQSLFTSTDLLLQGEHGQTSHAPLWRVYLETQRHQRSPAETTLLRSFPREALNSKNSVVISEHTE